MDPWLPYRRAGLVAFWQVVCLGNDMTSHILPFLAWLSFAAGSTGYVVFAKLAGRAERQGPRSGDGLLGPSWAGGTTPEGRKYRRKAFMSLGFGMLVALLFGALAVLQVSLRS